MNGKDSTLISEAVVRVSYNPKYKSINGLPVNFAIEVSELVLSEYKATLNAWLDQRIAFAQSEQKNDDDAQDAQGERYWMGVRTAYLGCKTKLAEIEKQD